MRSPRSVTMAPMGMPSRSLKFAIAFLARVTTGRWPLMAPSSSTAESRILAFCVASPSPMLRTIFDRRGTAMPFFRPRSRRSAGATSCRYRSRSRDAIRSALVQRLAAAPADALLLAGRQLLGADAGRLVALPADRHDVGRVDRRLLLLDPPGLLHPAGLHVPLHHVDAPDDHTAAVGEHAEDLARLAPLPTGDHHHRVVLAQPFERHRHSTSGASEMIF